ncbi:MAG: octanoyltransferase [Phycisphaeraceae bacterium]|nr:MAG: octanoyltransferase [Phycisphaeraceae bacterium]
MAYAEAYEVQQEHHAAVLASRDSDAPELGRILLVEHDPVVTVSRRPSAREHLLATPELLAEHGVDVQGTDRGGDITYHGPGQLVCYPIIDLNRAKLRLIEHVRVLEGAIIQTLGAFGVETVQDADATGVWVPGATGAPERKIAAIGIRVRRWISLHGLAINVTTDLEHFGLIVPCGLAGRPVTTMRAELGEACPAMDDVKRVLVERLTARLSERRAKA